jgi:hypothetical protein
MACTATIGVRLGANMSGENAKNGVNMNGGGVNGESMSAGNGTVGMTGMTRATNSARARSFGAGCCGHRAGRKRCDGEVA